MCMGTPALVSVEEYLRHRDKPSSEYIDGVLHPKAMPTTPHGRMQWMLLMLLNKFGIEALPEITLRLSPTKFLIPDVIAAKHIESPYPTEPVLLCAEILSPQDGVGSMLAKCEEYHAWGVPFCWVIDPMKKIAWEYDLGGEPTRIVSTGILHAGEIAVSVDELFSSL